MSHNEEEKSRKARVMVVGSHRFDQRDVINGLLNGFKLTMNLGSVISGPFSGADEFTRDWAKDNGVQYEPLILQDTDRMELRFFDQNRELPIQVVKHDEMFNKGFKKIRQIAPDLLVVIPTPEGRLGPTTCCLMQMAKMIDLPVMDAAVMLGQIEARLQAAVEHSQKMAQQPVMTPVGAGLLVDHQGQPLTRSLDEMEAAQMASGAGIASVEMVRPRNRSTV